MTTDSLRDLLSSQLSLASNSVTHDSLPALCNKLGLPVTPADSEMSKRKRLQKSLDAIDATALPGIAERLLVVRPVDPKTRNSIQDLLWSSASTPVPRRIRRELARSLQLEELYRDERKFMAVLDRFWVLDDDELELWSTTPSVRSLRARIQRWVFENRDWSVEDLFEQLGAFSAGSARFIRFLEALVSAEVHEDETSQRALVARIEPHFAACGLKLMEAGVDEGYPRFIVVSSSASPFKAPKQLIFASRIKPDLRLSDALNSDIEIVSNSEDVLVYDKPIDQSGLSWGALQDWWQEKEGHTDGRLAKETLYKRLRSSLPLNSPPQKRLFEAYFRTFRNEIPRLPALLPEVWLHWDHKTVAERGAAALLRFRMDFLMLLPQGVRVVIEIDGKQHYASSTGLADAKKYSEMAASDRDLKLSGYEVFRFGAHELAADTDAPAAEFFERLFDRFNVRGG